MFFGHSRKKIFGRKIVLEEEEERTLHQDIEKLTLGILEHRSTLKGHRKTVLSVLHFGFPHHLVFSCGMDSKILVWDDGTCKETACLGYHTGIVRQIIRWNDNCLMSCGDDGVIYAISAEPPHKIIKQFAVIPPDLGFARRLLSRDVYAISRISKIGNIKEDRFLACGDGHIFILSFSEKRVIRKLQNRNFAWMNALIHQSRLYENTFYLPVLSGNRPPNGRNSPNGYGYGGPIERRRGDIFLLNYELDVVEKVFVTPYEDRDHTRISALSIQRTHGKGDVVSDGRDVELLIACGETNSAIYTCDASRVEKHEEIYNELKRSFYFPNQEQNMPQLITMRRKLTLQTGWIHSSLIIRDRWLCLGEGFGGLGIYDSHMNFKRVGWFKPHSSSVQYITTGSYLGNIHIISGGTDKNVCITDTGIMAQFELSKLALEDIKDRSSYIIEFLEDQKYEEREERDSNVLMLSFLGGSVMFYRSFFFL